jgi:hypothetical protein
MASWCSYRIAQLLGRSDNGRQGSLPPFSQLSAPLTAQHLHLSLAVLNTFTLRRSEGESIQHRQPEMKMLDCEIEVHSFRQCWFQAQDGVLRRGTTPPRTPTAPLGGGGQAAMHWVACCPPTGAQVTGESSLLRMLSARAHVQEGLRARGCGRACADAWRRCTHAWC